MDAILAAAITEIQSVVSQFNNERHEADIDLVGIDMTGSIDMTTEPVQDPEVPDFVGGMPWTLHCESLRRIFATWFRLNWCLSGKSITMCVQDNGRTAG